MAVNVKSERELFRVDLGRGDFFIARLVDYEGAGLRLDLRRFFTTAEHALMHTSKGVAIRREWISDLRRALDTFEAQSGKS